MSYWGKSYWGGDYYAGDYWPPVSGAPPIIPTYPYYLYPGDMVFSRAVKLKQFLLRKVK